MAYLVRVVVYINSRLSVFPSRVRKGALRAPLVCLPLCAVLNFVALLEREGSTGTRWVTAQSRCSTNVEEVASRVI